MRTRRPRSRFWATAFPVVLLAASMEAGTAAQDDRDLAAELPRIPATAPADALKTFRLHEGFRLVPVAVEPLVTDPVDAAYDADGRLYVVEMRGYPYPENVPDGRVRRLEDFDGDGTFDRSTTFLDGLDWPTSVVPFDGGVFVAVAPDIIYARDTDGDGVADVRRVVFTGFGKENVQALFNGLLWGPDGWIYGVGGGNGGTITSPDRPEMEPLELGRRDFRFRPDGSRFEAISGGGQFGHAFDDWGHRFSCNNSNHIRQIALPAGYLARNPAYPAPSPIVDIGVEGGAAPVFRISEPEPWRVVRTRQRAADPEFRRRLPESELVVTGFFTSATGVTIYRGTAFPDDYHGNAFIGDVGGNLVHRKIVVPAGSLYEARRATAGVEFLASTDNWFRPVNFRNTPGGTLLVLDMYRETIEHPWSIPEPIKEHLDLTSGHDRGRLYEIVPDGFSPRERPRLEDAAVGELVDRLADADAWWRETAQRLLIERADPAAAPLLRRLAASRPTAIGRMHALWTLAATGSLTTGDLLPALSDAEPRVREASVRLAEPFLPDEATIRSAVLGLADDADAMVRFQAAFTIGEIPGPEATEALGRIVARDAADRWTRAAVMTSIRGRAGDLLVGLLDRPRFLDQSEAAVWIEALAEQVAATGGPEAARRLALTLGGLDAGPDVIRLALIGVGEGFRRSGGDPATLFQNTEAFVSVFERAETDATGLGTPSDRIAAIRLLAFMSADQSLEVLPPLLDAREPAEVQLAALRSIAVRTSPEVGREITAAWRTLGPGARREAIEVLMARPERRAALLDAIEAGTITPGELDPARREQLLKAANEAAREHAGRLLATTGVDPDRAGQIERYVSALGGTVDLDRGRTVFRRVCATCHRAEGTGAEVGPDLATITGRSPEDLVLHILDPNREVLPQYLDYSVATVDGRIVTGQITAESPGAITLKRAEGVTEIIPRDQIEELASTGKSLMPEGLEREVKLDEMADLVAYLRSLAGQADQK